MSARDWDWSLPHGHTTALGYASETVCSMALLAPLTGLPWQAGAIALTGAALGGIAYDIRQGTTAGTVAVRAASWLTTAAWASWALANAPLSPTGWAAGLATALIGAGLNISVTRSEPERKERKLDLKLRRKSVGVMRGWEDRIARVARIEGCQAGDIEWWPGRVGYTVAIDLPAGGTTADDIAPHSPKFAADLRLADGCGVEVKAGANRGSVVIEVTLTDIITEDLPFPEDYSDLTITERFAIGRHRNGAAALGGLCDDCGVLVGETDAGKTNQLRVITAQLSRMPDALIWGVDITGGGLALPWITPWATEGTASAPIFDWIAHSEDEARHMLTMAGEIIAARKAGYQQLMRSKGTDKLPVSADVPAIVILVDETASLSQDTKDLLDKVINEGRAVRVRVMTCGLRATLDVVSSAMKLQAKWRVGMTVSDPEELAYLFPGYVKIDTKDAPVAGSGWTIHTRLGPTKPSPFKGYHMPSSLIDKVCAAVAARRPTLDKLSYDVNPAAYDGRWARSLPTLYQGQQLTPDAQTTVDTAGPTPTTPAAPTTQPNTTATPPATGVAGMFAAVAARYETEDQDQAVTLDKPTPAPAP
ncbi:hypothetical protein, partial [Streptomyces sp. SM12]|uniref:hypothetical protein n=1 Tax=Streptomyces sp. SM12 TaxID=1071602 RepID=UPI000CD4AC3B